MYLLDHPLAPAILDPGTEATGLPHLDAQDQLAPLAGRQLILRTTQ